MKGGRFLGLIAFAVAFVLLFAWGYMNTPQYITVLAARQDLQAGTLLVDIPADALQEVQLSVKEGTMSESTLATQMYMSRAQFEALAARGGYLVENIHQYEMLRLMAVASSENPLKSIRAVLGMTDPDMLDSTFAFDMLPSGLLAGDCVDLVVVASELRDTAGGSALSSPLIPQATPFVYQTPALVYPNMTQTPSETPQPTATPTSQIILPVAKFVVYCARVVNVIKETQMVNNNGSPQVIFGNAIGLELVIPRDSAEIISMAVRAGVLQVWLRPFSVEDQLRKPSAGASMQDVLDMFYADRETLAKLTPTAAVAP